MRVCVCVCDSVFFSSGHLDRQKERNVVILAFNKDLPNFSMSLSE